MRRGSSTAGVAGEGIAAFFCLRSGCWRDSAAKCTRRRMGKGSLKAKVGGGDDGGVATRARLTGGNEGAGGFGVNGHGSGATCKVGGADGGGVLGRIAVPYAVLVDSDGWEEGFVRLWSEIGETAPQSLLGDWIEDNKY